LTDNKISFPLRERYEYLNHSYEGVLLKRASVEVDPIQIPRDVPPGRSLGSQGAEEVVLFPKLPTAPLGWVFPPGVDMQKTANGEIVVVDGDSCRAFINGRLMEFPDASQGVPGDAKYTPDGTVSCVASTSPVSPTPCEATESETYSIQLDL
jgi:hypothetical protein